MKSTTLSIVLSMLFLPMIAFSQISISTLGFLRTYTQNFDGTFPGTGDYTLPDNGSLNLGWYSFRTLGNVEGGNVLTSDTGNSVVEQFYNYGLAGDPNRALGSIASARTTGTIYYGLRLENDTSSTLHSVRVRYAGEQWRAFSPVASRLLFSYQLSAGDITSLTAGTFTFEPSLTFTTPINGFVGSLDGNLGRNRAVMDQTISIVIPAGSEIMLRWENANDDAIINHGIGIDDLTVTFSPSGGMPAPVSISGRVTTANGTSIGNAVLILTGGVLSEALIARTNPFGYYEINGIPAGNTYFLEVSANRYTFSQPTRLIRANDDVTDVDFIAE